MYYTIKPNEYSVHSVKAFTNYEDAVAHVTERFEATQEHYDIVKIVARMVPVTTAKLIVMQQEAPLLLPRAV